jgi:hypothetical protein
MALPRFSARRLLSRPAITRFLARLISFKTTADYGIGSTAAPITPNRAAAAIMTARRSSIDTITRLLPPGVAAAARPERATLDNESHRVPARCSVSFYWRGAIKKPVKRPTRNPAVTKPYIVIGTPAAFAIPGPAALSFSVNSLNYSL